MIPAIIVIVIVFIWLLIETDYMRVRLSCDYPLIPSYLKATTLRIEVSDLTIPLLYLGAIVAAELVVAMVDPLGGIIFHIVLLLGLIYHASIATNYPQSKLYLAIAMAPLIRLLSLSMPLTEFSQIYWYAITGAPLLIATLVVMHRLNFRLGQVGLTLNRLRFQLLVGLTGIPFGIAEFYILKPNPLVSSLAWQELVVPALILLVSTGFVEELIFRGVMQRSASEAIGRWGFVYIALLFAVLHVGYLSVVDFGLVLVVGLFFGWVVQKTGSLIGVSLSHGITNIILYLIVPLLMTCPNNLVHLLS